MTDSMVAAEGLTKAFGTNMVVDHLQFEIPRGSVVGFLGPNGAGKSTTIRMLLGLLKPSRGRGSLMGCDSQAIPPSLWSKIGYVSDESRFDDWMTVGSLIEFTRAFYSNWNEELERDLLQKLELPRDKKLKALSKGQRTKVSLLLALAYRPELLILDEPGTGLDPIVRHEFLEQIVELLQQEGRTVFFSSHILEEVERIADRIIILGNGRILVDEPLDDLKRSVRRVTLTFENSAPEIQFPNAIRPRRNGRHWTATILHFSDETMMQLRAFKPSQIEAEPLSLSEIFVETVKGADRL